ncbi:LOB domain-containing protein 27-like [Pyrus ussuriensis x Pyrus communis]|uniref:LOB domain-containing protein 27-like n=1 Tax=Pyrus ussuriensis x Pyrus communis TaxID=2448454 RepID=A0A5N5I106_9ROSA|nr:LOB domain-containing protein 27-like [Pyrus ussuriensis x Pyrus communis]
MFPISPLPFLLPLLLLQLTATLLLLLLLLILFNLSHCITLLSNCFRGFSPFRLSDWFQSHFGIQKMTLKGTTSQACAACKYQRRKCTAECPLAPYFPADQPKMYQNAHKLFGVSNILKILKNLDPRQKVEAMRSIIYQANLRDKFPVYGCWEVIRQLQYQILAAEEQLQAVHQQLAMYRQHHHQISSMPEYVMSQLELGMALPNNPLALFDYNLPPCILTNNNNATAVAPVNQHQQQSYSNSSSAAYNSDSKDNVNNNNNNAGNPLWSSNPFMTNNNNNNNNDNNSEAIESELGALQQLSIQPDVVQDFNELHPFFDTTDDRQSYIDSKEAYDSSSEESFKGTTQSMEHAENALKYDAACFSLTSVN